MFGGPWDSTLNMMGVPSLILGVPSFYISFEFWKVVVHPSVKAQCNCVVPRSVILRAMFGPLPIFWEGGWHLKFLRATLPSVKHNPICFFTKAELVPIICRTKLALKLREKK